MESSSDQKTIRALLEGQTTLRELAGVQDGQIEFLYKLAYNLFNQGHYSEGENLFSLLCLCDHHQERFWFGLGACRQRLGLYDGAVMAYRVAMQRGKRGARPAVLAAECYLAMGLPSQAIETLNEALALCSGEASADPLEDRIAALRRRANAQITPDDTASPAVPVHPTCQVTDEGVA